MFLFAAMASVALASCTTDESVFEGAKANGEKIEFVAANYAAQTRGGHDTIPLAGTNFKVYAWEKGKNYALIDGETMNYVSDAWTAASGTKYYWPNNTTLDFTAVAPAAAVDAIATPNRTVGGETTIAFEYTSTNNSKISTTNLMFADFRSQTYDYDSRASSATVPLCFRHMMAKLNVVVKQKDPDTFEDGVLAYEVKLKSVTFNKIYDEGNITVDAAYVAKAITDNANTIWNDQDGATSWTVMSTSGTSLQTNPITGTVPNQILEATAPAPYASTAVYYAMPQQIVDKVQEIVVTYQVVTTFKSGTVTTRDYTRTINLKDIDAVQNWYTNKNITYTINISPAELTAITFSAHEEKWCDEVTGDKEIE